MINHRFARLTHDLARFSQVYEKFLLGDKRDFLSCSELSQNSEKGQPFARPEIRTPLVFKAYIVSILYFSIYRFNSLHLYKINRILLS